MKKDNIDIYRFVTDSGNSYIFDNSSGMVFPCNDAEYYAILNATESTEEEIVNELIKIMGSPITKRICFTVKFRK